MFVTGVQTCALPILIQYRGLTEEQAHRAIEKQAMDTRQTRVAVAQTVINHYDE